MSEYRSSSTDFDHFLRSSIWSDIVMDLEMQIEDLRDILENPTTVDGYIMSNDVLITANKRGALEALRQMLSTPGRIRDNIKDDEEPNKKEEENDD